MSAYNFRVVCDCQGLVANNGYQKHNTWYNTIGRCAHNIDIIMGVMIVETGNRVRFVFGMVRTVNMKLKRGVVVWILRKNIHMIVNVHCDLWKQMHLYYECNNRNNHLRDFMIGDYVDMCNYAASCQIINIVRCLSECYHNTKNRFVLLFTGCHCYTKTHMGCKFIVIWL